MEKKTTLTTINIIRKSIHTFLQNYDHFTKTSILALPFSASLLLSTSPSLHSISFQTAIQFRLLSLFDALEIPISSEFISVYILKLSQTITSSILLLPFTFSFLLITKTLIIQSLNPNHKKTQSFIKIFNSILKTQIWNTIFVISTNTTSLCLLLIAFNFLQNLKIFSSSTLIKLFYIVGGITYSIVVANSIIICNMALVLSGIETKGGFISIVKSSVLIRKRSKIALSLALYINIILAGIEALFQFRVASVIYANSRTETRINSSALFLFEGLLIAYLYSMIIALDTIIWCVFYRTCKVAGFKDFLEEEEGRGHGCFLEVK